MNNIDWFNNGCEHCRQAVLSCNYESLREVGESLERQASLRKCTICNAFWEFNMREAHVIDNKDVIKYYTNVKN